MGLWRVLSDLEEEGYDVAAGIFSAEEVGAPHQRKRVFILAQLPDSRSPHGGEVQFAEGRAEEDAKEQESDRNGNQRGVGQLGNPPSLRPRGGCEDCEGEQSEVLGERLESDAELAHPSSGSARTELRDVAKKDAGEGRSQVQHEDQTGQPECRSEQTTELATPASGQPGKSQARNGRKDTSGGSEEPRWPARPGEEQYEWEEPRVVAYSKVKRCGGRENKDGENRERISEQEGEERSILRSETEGCSGDGETANDETESELVRTTARPPSGVDAIANRVDRLRLLGNGVVSQCAELAWRTLWKELNEKK